MNLFYFILLTYLNAYLSAIKPTYKSIFIHFSIEIRYKTMKDSTKTTSLPEKRSLRDPCVKAVATQRIQNSFLLDNYFGNPKKQFTCTQWNYNKSLISTQNNSARLIKNLQKDLYRNKQIEMSVKDFKDQLANKLKYLHHNDNYSDVNNQIKKRGDGEKILNINKLLPAVSVHLERKYHDIRTWISSIWKQHHNTLDVINQKNNTEDSTTFIRTIVIFVILIINYLFVCLIFIYLKYQLLKKQRKELEISALKIKDHSKKTNTLNIKDSILKEILQRLEDFENNKEFLSENIHLNNLAERWHTNRNYLSNCINTYKEKSFIDYVNDLRIKHFIENLKENHKRFRCLKIAAIGQELGFSSARSFSKAFVKVMNIPLSQYLAQFAQESK